MLDPKTLRGRLTIGYALALLGALIVFAGFALLVIDRAQRSALDAQLATNARAVIAIANSAEDQSGASDDVDRQQLSSVLGGRANAAILRRDGTVFISSAAVPTPVRRLATGAVSPMFATRSVANEAQRVFAAPLTAGSGTIGSVAIWRDADAITTLDRIVAAAFAVVIPILVVVAVLFGSAISRRGLAPLDRIAKLASEIEAEDLSRRVGPPARDDELGRLAATIDRMLDRLQRAFDQQQRFAADASHELRAPLSVIRAQADLALRTERTSQEYQAALQTIADEADALERVTRDLLAASRADSRPGAGVEIDLGALATRCASRLATLAETRDIALQVDARRPAVVLGNPNAIERALLTVVHNAIKYASAAVAIHVERIDGQMQVSVTDDGRGFTEAAFAHAFDRFWRDDEARGRDGSGLGLAIAKAAVETSGGSITLANGPAGGALVRIRLPIRSTAR